MIECPCKVVFQTHGPGFHFLGYYDVSPLNRAGSRLLTHHGVFESRRMPRAGDVVQVGYWSIDERRYHPVAETGAFNWQQGARLQWLPPDFDSRIIFNASESGRFVSRILDLGDGSTRTLPHPVYTVHPAGRSAICVNFPRLMFTHPGYAYAGDLDPRWGGSLPDGDGLFRIDLETGDSSLVVATKDLKRFRPVASMDGATHYLDHAMFSPGGHRFCFLHRWDLPDGGMYTRLFTADEWGRGVRCLLDSGRVTHTGWRGDRELVAWGRVPSPVASLRRSRWISRYLLRPLLPLYHRVAGARGLLRSTLIGDSYLLIEESTGRSRRLAPGVRFADDGHPSWHPHDRRWMLTDTYEDAEFQRDLLLYDHDRQLLLRVGRFASDPATCSTGFRCDLHPRWVSNGRYVCIDSTHANGERQVYLIDVSPAITSEARSWP